MSFKTGKMASQVNGDMLGEPIFSTEPSGNKTSGCDEKPINCGINCEKPINFHAHNACISFHVDWTSFRAFAWPFLSVTVPYILPIHAEYGSLPFPISIRNLTMIVKKMPPNHLVLYMLS